MIQSLHIGVLPTALHNSSASATANHAALLTNTMPPAWIRGAIVVRTNTLVRGHSGVRWRLLESMVDLLNKDVVPVRNESWRFSSLLRRARI
jgi:phenylalanine ammonia-lyase